MRLDQGLVGEVSRDSRRGEAQNISQQGGVPFLGFLRVNASKHVLGNAGDLIRAAAGVSLFDERPGCDSHADEQCKYDSRRRRESDLMTPDRFLELIQPAPRTRGHRLVAQMPLDI